MYRLLLVDDELDVLEYFGRIIKENLCLKTDLDVYMMDSAEKALECFSEFKVDVIISDIQMPGMDGVEMYQEIRKTWPKVKFIFLTGYMDFDYVYASAQDGNTRFLTKLEPIEKIAGTIQEVLEELEKDYREKEILQRAKEESKLAFPLLRNKTIGQFLNGTGSRELIQGNFKKFQIDLNLSKEIILLGASLDIQESTIDIELQERLGFVLKTLMNTYFREDFVIYNYLSEHQIMPYIWILQKNKEENGIKVEEQLEYVQHAFSKSVEDTMSFAYGIVLPDFGEITRMYRRIQNILGYRDREIAESIIPCNVKMGAGSTVWEDEDLKESWKQLDRISELDGYMELGMEEKFFCLFDLLVENLPRIRSMNYTLAQEIYYRIAVLLLRYINMWQLYEKMAFQVEMYKLMRAEMHEDWAHAVSFLRLTAKKIFRLYFKEERDGITTYIAFVKSYIKEHLQDDLNLVVLAEAVHLNASYLSRLFHKETGKKLYDYISCMRMNKAKEYIIKDTRRIQDIAKSVGYESVQSFNRAFKKHTGMSPLDYRNGVKEREEK